MFPADVFRATLEKFTATLVQRGIRFHLTGGVTSIAYGEPRMTQDVDLVVDPASLRRHLDELLAAWLTTGFLLHEPTVRRAVAEGGLFQLLDKAEALKLDVYPRELIPGELDRSQNCELFPGREFPIVSRTDAAASKLVWISKGSHKSRRDLRHLVRTSSPHDQQEIARLAEQLSLRALLDEVLAESDEIR